MARPIRVEYPGAFYHITSRGNEKKEIFKSEGDKEKFLSYLEKAKERFGIVVHAYCLMSNHYHLLLETPEANLSKSMQYINSSYTTYFNVKRKRYGHLFQGRYKGILIQKDQYLQTLSRYIHLNPLRAGLVKKVSEYKWSSYNYYANREKTPTFLALDYTLSCFGNSRKRYADYVAEGIAKSVESPLKKLNKWSVLGTEEFVNVIKERYLSEQKESRDLPKRGNEKITFDVVAAAVRDLKNISEKEENQLIIYFLRKYTALSLSEIADTIEGKKLSVSAISILVTRLNKKRNSNKEMAQLMNEVDGLLSNV